MPFKEKLAKLTGIDKDCIPASYQIIGHVMLLKFMKIKNQARKNKIASAILSAFPYVKTVCEIIRVESELRIPKVRRLAGDGTITTHKEHGILYRLDAAKIMFSKGNLFERKRLIDRVKPGETIADMFAGIGYFSLPLAKRAKEVIAIEKNPVSFKYLLENIGLNRIKNISPVLSDNRSVPLENVADRVVMGYFPGTEKFLPFALKMLKIKGTIHFHNAYRKDDLWKKPLDTMESMLENMKWELLEKKIVKSVAPNTYHVVMDISVAK